MLEIYQNYTLGQGIFPFIVTGNMIREMRQLRY
jgi:hypothetical protein